MNLEVTEFIDGQKEQWKEELCASLREVVHEAIPDVQERMQYKKPHFLKSGKYAAVISTSKDAVSFTIFNTAGFSLPEGFDGPPERKTIKLRQGQQIDSQQFVDLVGQAASTL
ncbi:DUF1801 domain-containing protein [Brevibacillus reuszeri]|uniref:DUF1801 domain-containing protein n=1 Tax=Brevibacillus reuszeri TaxID=54915 RepID=UPI000CCC5C1A|nr:DUF1801 domain-containing protein [Brevibacillus reuszeri]